MGRHDDALSMGEHEYDPIFLRPPINCCSYYYRVGYSNGILQIDGGSASSGPSNGASSIKTTMPAAGSAPSSHHQILRVSPQTLVYLELSPDYCWANSTAGIYPLFSFSLFLCVNNIWTNIGTSGTKGRTCSRDKGTGLSASQRRSCIHLCRNCGHKVKRRVSTVLTSCNCTFQWYKNALWFN